MWRRERGKGVGCGGGRRRKKKEREKKIKQKPIKQEEALCVMKREGREKKKLMSERKG